MLIKTILFKNNLIKKIKSKNILKTKKKFLELKKDYKKKKIPLLTSFEKNYKLGYSKKLVKVLRKNKNIILVGMGGSILGAKALYSFLRRKIKKNFFFQDNLSEKNILELNSKKFNKPAYIFISKSGNTIETIANINLIIQNKKKNNIKIFITEKTKNAIILDLYSGTGSFGLECLSRDANKVTFVENNNNALKILQKNIYKLNIEKKTSVIEYSVLNYLSNIDNFNHRVDLIFLDPPYKEKNIFELINNIIKANILKKNGIIIIHRNKKSKDNYPNNFKILDIRKYGISKIIFGNLAF